MDLAQTGLLPQISEKVRLSLTSLFDLR